MNKIKALLIFFAISFLPLVSFTQILNPVKWNVSVYKVSEAEANIVFTAKIDAKWHLYSQTIPAGGPLPTVFTFEKNSAYKIVGRPYESPKPNEEYDPTFEMNIKSWTGSATFTQRISILKKEKFNFKGIIEYMSCNDGSCVPLDYEFSIPVDGSKYSLENISESDTMVDDTVVAQVVSTDTVSTITAEPNVEAESNENEGRSLWGIILEAILWGFAALLTPCVFPMIPMTVSFFMKSSDNVRKNRFMASSYGISIVALYTIPIAALILITYFVGGASVTADIFNWISTHWIPNILFFLIFMIFAASFLGAFEIVLPSKLTNKADANSDKGGLVGVFFMAFTLVLVSFSCTGPIVGSIIVKSLSGDIWEPIITMLAFSMAFALPFTLFAFFPSWLNKLPKSGGWLNSVKVVLGFIEIALGFKFLSVADQVYHWGILDREVYLAIWIVVFSLLGLYLLGKLKFKHDSDLKYIGIGRLSLAIVSFAFVVYMIPGMWGAPLKALSGYMPPQQTLDFDINRIVRENVELYSDKAEDLCETPKFEDILPKLPHGLQGYHDLDQALACAKQQNKPVFVDFTGHGCVNCREMEANVWSNPEVLKRLKKDYIIVALYVDDKTELPEAEWVTSSYDGKVKKTIGKKFADLQVTRYNVNAQPYYVLLDSEGKDLTTPKSYDLNADNFVKFLDNGLEEFNNRNKK